LDKSGFSPGYAQGFLKMLVEDIQHIVGQSPKKKQAGN
jgi:hypothetical protein